MPSIVLQPSDEGSLDEKLGLIAHEETYEVPDLVTAITFLPDSAPLAWSLCAGTGSAARAANATTAC